MADPQVVMVLQGGGALGVYQGGVFAGLSVNDFDVDWVVGTSIGAINGAIIAGNPPQKRAEKLKAFWDYVATDGPAFLPWIGALDWWRPWMMATRTLGTMLNGIPGFFLPRYRPDWHSLHAAMPNQVSFYDTAPLEATLTRFVDFELLNQGPVRLTVGAVNVETAALELFSNRKPHRITPRHIMASGALPPGFPPVKIGDTQYWDGGIYSNTPMDIVLDDAERRDTLCFMIDLWDPTETAPDSIAGAIARAKDIQYASRSREHLEDHRRMQNLRRAIRILSQHVPAKLRQSAELLPLQALGCDSKINIVRLIMKALPHDDNLKDIDFDRATLQARWEAGKRDAQRALRHKSWLAPMAPDVGMVIHELPQD